MKRRVSRQFARQEAMSRIITLVWQQTLQGHLDASVSCQRVGNATTITMLHHEGVFNFIVRDTDLQDESERMTKRARDARQLLDSTSAEPPIRWPGKTRFRQAMNCVGTFIARAIQRKSNLLLSVSTQRHIVHIVEDRLTRMEVTVLTVSCADGTFTFEIPATDLQHEQDAAAHREAVAPVRPNVTL